MNSVMTMTDARTLRVQSGNVGLAVTCRGDANLPTVVLVHGYPDNSAVWDQVVAELADDFHVVTYDVRGAGESDIPKRTEDYRLELLSQDLKAVADAVCPDRPFHLVAHDWGSLQSWESVTDPEFQQRIASYTTVSGPCLDHAGHWLRNRLRRPTPRNIKLALSQLLHSWYVLMFHLPLLAPLFWRLGLGRSWPRLLAKLEGVQGERSATRTRDGVHGVKLYRANFLPRLRDSRLRHTTVPVQLVVPTRERFMVAEIFDELTQWAPKLWRREFVAGHWLPLSHPRQLAGFVREFITLHEGGVESGEESAELRSARVVEGKGYAGKLVVVTGAGSGIGRETALDFAERGATVVAADLNADAAERTAELARLLGAEARGFAVDVGSCEAMEAFAAEVKAQLGVPDIVVNNAGIGMAGPVLDTSVSDWQRILNVNLWGVINGARLFARQMVDAGKPGHIVNTSSGLAFFPTRSTPAYATTKAAVQMFSECLRAELADQGIGVSAVYPGVVNTGIVNRTRFVGTADAEQNRRRAAVQKLYALRNLGPKAVAAGVRRAVEKNLPEVRIGAEVHLIRWIARLLPGLGRRLARIEATP